MENRFCDEDCNNCPIIGHKNSKMVSYILNILYNKFGSDVNKILNQTCPNLTVCYECRIDDFCHFEDCKIAKKAEKESKNDIIND